MNFDKVKEAFEKKGVPPEIIKLYDHWLRNRTIKSELGTAESMCFPRKGGPQRGVASPLAWNAFFQSAVEISKGSAIEVYGYADDLVFIITGINTPSMIN